jgi:acetylornithine deacetylase
MNNHSIHTLTADVLALLQELIAIPSPSRQEDKTASCLEIFLAKNDIAFHRLGNNLWCANVFFDDNKPTVLLNSHHDTVAPNAAYTRDPYHAAIEDGKLFGLGSTDAGASLVSLLACFIHYYRSENLPYNLMWAASAEEENSGTGGIELLFGNDDFIKKVSHPRSFAIVGEPTQLELAIAEKGLMVLDCVVHGKPGHAARDEGDNAIYKAIPIIEWFRNFRFPKVSPLLGPVKMTVTSIHTPNVAHNVVPSQCNFIVDVRINECYSHEEIIEQIQKETGVELKPRSTRLRSSSIAAHHPVVEAGLKLGKKTYGSPTTSDQALIPLPSLKCGPGFSGQSHSANEFVAVQDLKDGVAFYINLLAEMGMKK